MTHAAVKTGVEEKDVGYLSGNEKFSNERWSELIGKTLESSKGSDGRRIGESGFRRLTYARGQAASETSLFYQQPMSSWQC